MYYFIAILFALNLLRPDAALAQRDRFPPRFQPDLVVTNISYPQSVSNGFLVQVTVKNIGRGLAPSSNLLFLDNNNTTSQMRTVPSLGYLHSTVISLLVSPPENQGPWYFSAIADYGNSIHELNETNNVKNFFQY